MTIANTKSRRQFLGTATRLFASTNAAIGPGSWPLVSGLAGLGAMAASSSHAADVSGGYKALVCLFMNGGNDSHNWVVPTDPTGYAEYAAARRELAWPLSKLSPIAVSGQASGRSFGMPEELAPMRKWYEAGQAAIIANVGTLSRPTTKADYMAGISIPSKLFSHNDQASTWQSLLPEGARTGWGGRMADALMAANAYPVFTAISTTGNAVFLSGTGVSQYHVGVEGPVSVAAIKDDMTLGSRTASAILRRSVIAQGTDPLQAEYAKVMRRSLETSAILQSTLPGTNVPAIPAVAIPSPLGGTTTLDKDGLAQQLRMVAMMIMAGQTLGMRRQIFMVSISGFDSHANQMRDQPSLMARVANSIDYFLNTMHGKGMLGNVTLFTASDFGRTLVSNGSGSDHGWGSHHFVAGGSVSGRNIYGRFPTLGLGSADDVGSGRLLPGSSVTQVAAPLGRWLGLSEADLASVLPGIGNFDSRALRFI